MNKLGVIINRYRFFVFVNNIFYKYNVYFIKNIEISKLDEFVLEIILKL